jgi:alkylation response protein AidB-like acyl-CoA dehydrogenase
VDFSLPPELVELQASVRRLTRDKIAARAREIDETGEYPQDVFEAFRDAGLLSLCIPEEYGGAGAGLLGLTVAIEEVAKHSNVCGLMLLLTRLPTGAIMIAGTEEQKQRYLPSIASGDTRAAFALSEPQAGSDVMGQRTRAVRVDGGWRVTGTKCWISGVRQADWYCVAAKTSEDPASRGHDSMTIFLVDRKAEGVSIGTIDRKMGVKGIDTGELVLDSVFVPDSDVLGEVGGFRVVMEGLNAMRPIVAARGIGLAEGALMYTVDYIKSREAFGKTIADMQGVQWEIAKLATEIEAARLLTYRAAWMADRGEYQKKYIAYLSMSKYYATELAVKASGICLQLLGAAGYMKDHPTEQWYRDARQLTIVEGTSQIQLGMIAKGLLAGDLWWD